MASVTLIAPAGFNGTIQGLSPSSYSVNSDGTVTVANSGDVLPLIRLGFRFFRVGVARNFIEAPVAADLISIKAAATPVNGAITIAAQPIHARKFQVRIVIGTTTTTAITAGTLTLVGTDQDGNAVTEVISLVQNASATVKSVNAYSSLTSGTVANYAAAGSGTGNTLGIGVSNDFGVTTSQGLVVDFVLVKATKATKVLGTSITAADDVASTATVDAVARTVAPTTAPSASGLVDYDFTVQYGLAD